VRIELVVKSNTSFKSQFSRWRKAPVIKNRTSVKLKKHKYLSEKKPNIVLEAGTPRALFPCEN
jgi:hypothetical protein